MYVWQRQVLSFVVMVVSFAVLIVPAVKAHTYTESYIHESSRYLIRRHGRCRHCWADGCAESRFHDRPQGVAHGCDCQTNRAVCCRWRARFFGRICTGKQGATDTRYRRSLLKKEFQNGSHSSRTLQQ